MTTGVLLDVVPKPAVKALLPQPASLVALFDVSLDITPPGASSSGNSSSNNNSAWASKIQGADLQLEGGVRGEDGHCDGFR